MIISLLLGVAVGLGLREFFPDDGPVKLSAERSVREAPAVSNKEELLILGLSWGLEGDLGVEELRMRSRGARRMAESALWLRNASPEEMRSYWDFLSEDLTGNRQEMRQIMAQWIAKDFDGAMAHVEKTAGEYLFHIAHAKINPEAALALANKRGLHFYKCAVASVAEDDPEKGRKLLENIGEVSRDLVVSSIAEGLFEEDPEAAVNFASLELHYHKPQDLIRRWIKKDPPSALSWCFKNQHEMGVQMTPLFYKRMPSQFSEEIENLPTGRYKKELVAAKAKAMAESDSHGAIRFAQGQKGIVKRSALLSIGERVSNTQSAVAFEVLEGLLEVESNSVDLEDKLEQHQWVQSVLQKSPQQFMDLVSDVGSDDFRESMTKRLIQSWYDRSPEQVAAYIQSSQSTAEQVRIFRSISKSE